MGGFVKHVNFQQSFIRLGFHSPGKPTCPFLHPLSTELMWTKKGWSSWDLILDHVSSTYMNQWLGGVPGKDVKAVFSCKPSDWRSLVEKRQKVFYLNFIQTSEFFSLFSGETDDFGDTFMWVCFCSYGGAARSSVCCWKWSTPRTETGC